MSQPPEEDQTTWGSVFLVWTFYVILVVVFLFATPNCAITRFYRW